MKVAWAINPFDTNKTVYKQGTQILGALGPKYIEIVCIAAPSMLDLSLAFDIPEEERYSRYLQKKLEEIQSEYKIKANKITVIYVPSSSKSTQVANLSQYLKLKKFDCVLMPSHARTGVDRFFQGSFTETMVLNSKVDILIYNPTYSSHRKIKKILFAHDGSKISTRHLQAIHHLTKKKNVQIEVLYVLPTIANSFDGGTALFIENYSDLIQKTIKTLKARIEKIDAQIKFSTRDSNQSISDVILSTAKGSKSDLIVVSAKIGTVIAGLGGSISRQVIRKATCPVLVKK